MHAAINVLSSWSCSSPRYSIVVAVVVAVLVVVGLVQMKQTNYAAIVGLNREVDEKKDSQQVFNPSKKNFCLSFFVSLYVVILEIQRREAGRLAFPAI